MKKQLIITLSLLLGLMLGLQTLQAQASNLIEEDFPRPGGFSCYWQGGDLHLTGSWQGVVTEIVIVDRNGNEVFRTTQIAGIIKLPTLSAGTYYVHFYGATGYLGTEEIIVT